MSNKSILENKVKSLGMSLGTYDNKINALTKTNLDKLIQSITGDSTDIELIHNRKPYLIEVYQVDNELDFIMLTKEEYIDRYGDEKWENE